ncbi:MAG: beta-lactamase domain protein [Verrucomicrobia bacterium]|nr:beta-lactamase domain protein [Verrucomicrobiota bacterium]
MNRREFLVRSSLLASAGLAARSDIFGQPSAPAAPASPDAVTAFRPLRRGVGLFTGRGGTIGWLSSKDALVVVDTQFPDTAAICLAGLPDRGARMIDVVLNTHHHADHTSGNGVFKAAARTIVAQDNVPKLMFAAAERAAKTDRPGAPGSGRPNLAQQTFPDATFKDVWRRDFGDEIVTAQYFGPAHTSGDVVVLFEKANVVHMGDIVFNRLYPVIDRPSGGSIHGWIARLEEVAKTYPADAIYVCGHGSTKFGVTTTRDDLLVFRDYFSAVLEYVQKEIATGKSKAEIVTLENLPGFPDFHAPRPNRLGGNLGVAYDELTEKKV